MEDTKIATFYCKAEEKDMMDRNINEFFKGKEIVEFHPKVTIGNHQIHYHYFFLYRMKN